VLPGSAWSARPTSTNLHAVGGCRRGRPGPGPGAAPRRSPRRSSGAAPQACCPAEGRLASCLSFCLIHPRPGPFADVHPDRVCAFRGRWRTPVNGGQHCWKACWQRRAGRLTAATTSLASPTEAGSESGGGQQGQAWVVVGGLDGKDRINADSFVGGHAGSDMQHRIRRSPECRDRRGSSRYLTVRRSSPRAPGRRGARRSAMQYSGVSHRPDDTAASTW
jgi:hypothetical protein